MSSLFDDLAALHDAVADQAAPTIVIKQDQLSAPVLKVAARGLKNLAAGGFQPASFRSTEMAGAGLTLGSPEASAAVVRRDRLKTPICLAKEVKDHALFEDAADASQKFHLPRYRLAEQMVSGKSQYRVTLEPAGEGWSLTLHLEKYPAPTLGEKARGTKVVTHETAVILRHRVKSGQAEPKKEIRFQEVNFEDTGLRAVWRGDTSERDRLFAAITNEAYEATLEVQRTLQTALEIPLNHTKMYWTEVAGRKIRRANLDGSQAEDLVTGLGNPQGLALDFLQGKIYWADAGANKIQRANFDGLRVEDLVTGLSGPVGLALDLAGGKMYFTNANAGKIQRAGLDGAQVEDLVSGLSSPCGLALDLPGGKMYWVDTSSHTIRRANLDGSKVEDLVTGLQRPTGPKMLRNVTALEVAGGKIYWLNPGLKAIFRANLDGSSVEPVVSGIIGPNYASGIALDPRQGKMYFAGGEKIGRANLEGSNVEELIGGLGAPTAVALPIFKPLLFREVTRTLDNVDEDGTPISFVFAPELHAYIFRKVAGGAGGAGLVKHAVEWRDNVFYSYYQDESRPDVFNYLPDAFKIARSRRNSPDYPKPTLLVKFSSADGSLDGMQATMDYFATPFVDRARILAAARALWPKLKSTLPAGITGLTFQPLQQVKALRFRLALPRASSNPSSYEDRTAFVKLSLQLGLGERLILSLEDFQEVWNAMFGEALNLFTGEVVVELEGFEEERIPFRGRLGDLVGDLFNLDRIPDPGSGGLQITLRNAIESRIRINGLPAALRRADNREHRVPALVQGLSFAKPIELNPGDETRFVIVPEKPIPGEGALDVEFDLNETAVFPDQGTIWDAILANKNAEYVRTVSVETFVFKSQQESVETIKDPVKAIVVDFKRGKDVKLTSEGAEGETQISFPIREVVLRQASEGEYEYRVTTVRASGAKTESEWRKDTTDFLFL